MNHICYACVLHMTVTNVIFLLVIGAQNSKHVRDQSMSSIYYVVESCRIKFTTSVCKLLFSKVWSILAFYIPNIYLWCFLRDINHIHYRVKVLCNKVGNSFIIIKDKTFHQFERIKICIPSKTWAYSHLLWAYLIFFLSNWILLSQNMTHPITRIINKDMIIITICNYV